MKNRFSTTICAASCAAAALSLLLASPASARPNYLKEFQTVYPSVTEASTVKCGVCHMGSPSAKKWNDYGEAMGTALAGKNVKLGEKVQTSLKGIEASKSGTDGKTFGELLKAGKLPGNQ